MSQLISGFGRFDLTNTNSSLPEFWFVEPVGFQINGNSNKVESRKYVDGKNVRAASKILQIDYTMGVTIEASSYSSLQVSLGIKSAKVDADLPELRFGSIPATGAAEITDADLGAALQAQAFITESGPWGEEGPLTLLATGTPVAGQFKIDATNNKLVFAAAAAGAPIAYRLVKSYTQIDSIGALATAKALTRFSFSGLGYTDSGEYYKVVAPQLNLAKVPSLAFDEVTKLELEYDLAVATGYSTAFQLYKMPSGYTP